MASRKEYEMLFQLNAQLGSSYTSTFKNAQGAITAMQKEIAALSKTQSDISAYQKQQSAVEASKKKLEMLKQQYDNIQKEMKETGTFSSALENRLLAKQQQIDKTTSSLSAQTSKLEQMRNALKDAGVNTADLSGETAKLGNQIDELKQKQEEAADEAHNFGATASAAFGAVGQALVAAGITVALKEMAEYMGEFAEASMEFESAMTGVDKTTELTNEELLAMGEEIKALSTEIPIVTEELAGIGEVAGQLGIAKENLLDFSTVMAMLSTATTMTAEEAATLLAQFANITRMDPAYYSNLASAIVDLGNNYATTEQKITEMAQGIAASASLAGMTEADMVALSAAVTSLGIETQAGSTSMSRLISELMKAVETGDNLTEFASIANMTAEGFAEAWGNNAVTALQSFIVGLNDTERNGKSATVALNELGITEARMQRMVLSLANSGDLLNRTLATSTQAWAENTALTNEAEKRYATTQSQLVLMQNAYNNLRIAIGDNYTPVLRQLYAVATDVLGNVTAFVQEHPELVRAVTAFVGVIGTAVAGLGAYAAIVKVVIPLTTAFTASIPGINVIMAVVGGIALLTAGIAAFADATRKGEEEIQELTAASRAQYYQLESMREEYEEVCSVMGETSAEAQLLRSKLDDAEEAFRSNKQTSEELAAAHREVIDAHNELVDAYGDTIDGLDDESTSATNLMKKLEELMLVEGKSAETKQEILAVVELLNEAMPELGLAYDQYADSLNMSADAIRSVIEAEIARERNAANYEKLKALIAEEGALYDNLQTHIRETAAAQEELTAAQAAEAAKRKELGNVSGEAAGRAYAQALMPYVLAVRSASAAVTESTEAEREAQEAYDENQALIEELTAALAGYAEETGNADGVTDNLTGKIRDITGRMAELAEAYEEAYNAAIDSVQGQYELWDEASKVVETSAWKINNALESQVEYWQDYNKNLASLTERSADIEGLAEMIASFADGSEGSVNAVAGMAKATDSELKAMVENWQKLQTEQKTVAESLADLETEFTASMDALQLELETTIEEMDLNNEAAKSGKNTIQGFIDGAEEMLPAVEAAYARIANAAVKAIDARLQIRSPSKVFEDRGEYAMSGFVGGVVAMEPEVTAAMKDAANIGIEAFTEEESKTASLIPQFMQYLKALWSGNDAVAAQSGGGNASYFHLVVSPQYEITGAVNPSELEGVLSRNTSNIKELVLDILEEHGIDKARRAFA